MTNRHTNKKKKEEKKGKKIALSDQSTKKVEAQQRPSGEPQALLHK